MIFATQKGFKGIDHRGAFGADLGVASEMVNFRINESGALVKRQGIRNIFEADNEIKRLLFLRQGASFTEFHPTVPPSLYI